MDHKGLEYFMTTKKLTPRQARWAEYLSKYNFTISYQSGRKNDKSDALTCKPNERFASNNNEKLKHCMQILLPFEQFEHAVDLQSIEQAELHAEPQSPTISAKHSVTNLIFQIRSVTNHNY